MNPPNPEFERARADVERLLGPAGGRVLSEARLLPHGMELVFQDKQEQVQVTIRPKVYTDGKVIVDPINDLVLILRVRRYALPKDKAGEQTLVDESTVELPYSTWFDEGDFR